MPVEKIISGGQTGADRAGLDWAITNGVPHGGFCPKGRKAEDGPIPEEYQLQETPTADYLQRNQWNVRDSDATVIFTMGATLGGGSKRTAEFAEKQQKPWIHLHEGLGLDECAARLKGVHRAAPGQGAECGWVEGFERAESGGVCEGGARNSQVNVRQSLKPHLTIGIMKNT